MSDLFRVEDSNPFKIDGEVFITEEDRAEFEALKEKRESESRKADLIKWSENMRRLLIKDTDCLDYTFANDNGQDPETVAKAKNFVKHIDEFARRGCGILFWGDVGTGKTFAAYAIANALIDIQKFVYCTSSIAIIEMAQDFNNWPNTMKKILSHKFVLIDDLGSNRDTSFGIERVYKFIDDCIKNNICMIITTNLSIKDMLSVTNAEKTNLNIEFARIYDRVLERCIQIKVNKIKQRKIKLKENYKQLEKLL